MYRNYCLIFILFLKCFVNSNSDVPVVKCKSEDSKCLTQQAEKLIPVVAAGIPQYGMKPLDPMTIKSINASTSGLVFKLTDVTVKGLSGCNVEKAQRDVIKGKIYIDLLCDIEVDGDYQSTGQLLLVPIQGHGKAHIAMRKFLIETVSDLSNKEHKDGRTYWTIKKWSFEYDLLDKSFIDLENLFDGNEILSQASKNLLQNNSKDVIMGIGGPVIYTITENVMKAVQHFYNHIPADELSDEPWL